MWNTPPNIGGIIIRVRLLSRTFSTIEVSSPSAVRTLLHHCTQGVFSPNVVHVCASGISVSRLFTNLVRTLNAQLRILTTYSRVYLYCALTRNFCLEERWVGCTLWLTQPVAHLFAALNNESPGSLA
jgi:hypothetical protein